VNMVLQKIRVKTKYWMRLFEFLRASGQSKNWLGCTVASHAKVHRPSLTTLAAVIVKSGDPDGQIACSQLAVDGEVENREITCPRRKLQANPDGPDLPRFQWRLLSCELALVPRDAYRCVDRGLFHDVPFQMKGTLVCAGCR
jgi:hypothetical protein